MASLPYNLVKAEQLVDGRLTTMLNYTDNSISILCTLRKKNFPLGRKRGPCGIRVGRLWLALLYSLYAFRSDSLELF